MVEEVTESSATLSWSPPLSDGGSPITGYDIQKKDRFSPRWTTTGNVPGDVTEFKATGLKEGDEIQFRVVPKNKAGEGKPSSPVTVTPKSQFGESTCSLKDPQQQLLVCAESHSCNDIINFVDIHEEKGEGVGPNMKGKGLGKILA